MRQGYEYRGSPETVGDAPNSAFRVEVCSDTTVILSDINTGRSLTNDAAKVVPWLASHLDGLGSRRVYYRDSDGRFDELAHDGHRFIGFRPGTDSQQSSLAAMVNNAQRD